MHSLFFWELGPARVYWIWLLVFVLQIAIAEINRRWNWTIFVLWTGVGIIMMPYAWKVGVPILGWFPFAKYALMVATATITGLILVLGKRYPDRSHRYVMWFGVALWACLVFNIMEANIRDILIYMARDEYYTCAANWQCLQQIDATHGADMLSGLPEARNIDAPAHSVAWYQAMAANFEAHHVGIDPETGFRTIGGYWNIMSAVAGILNCITVTGLGRVVVTRNKDTKVRGLIWVDQIWPWIIAYDLWNHAYLYNALSDYTWYCTLALLLACTVPAFTWAKGQWIWFRCFTLMFWIAFYNWIPTISTPPGAMTNFSTMDPKANIVSAALALVSNVLVFIYWLYKVVTTRRNPITDSLFIDSKAVRNVVLTHCDDKDKYFLTDMVPETPEELGWQPKKSVPPVDGFVTHFGWWGKQDKRYPKLRTPVAASDALKDKEIESDPQWDVTQELVDAAPPVRTEVSK